LDLVPWKGTSDVSPDFWQTSPRPAIAKDRTLLSGVPVAALTITTAERTPAQPAA